MKNKKIQIKKIYQQVAGGVKATGIRTDCPYAYMWVNRSVETQIKKVKAYQRFVDSANAWRSRQ